MTAIKSLLDIGFANAELKRTIWRATVPATTKREDTRDPIFLCNMAGIIEDGHIVEFRDERGTWFYIAEVERVDKDRALVFTRIIANAEDSNVADVALKDAKIDEYVNQESLRTEYRVVRNHQVLKAGFKTKKAAQDFKDGVV